MNQQKIVNKSNQQNWYITYDFEMFECFDREDFNSRVYTITREYGSRSECEGTMETISTSEELRAVTESISDIITLLFNFFYVEEKLTSVEVAKQVYFRLYMILKVQTQYCKLFQSIGQNFVRDRVISSMLRLKRFLDIFNREIKTINRELDQNFRDNLQEVYSFVEQKISQTIVKTQKSGKTNINIILLDILLLIHRMNGDTSMLAILDKNTQRSIISNIEKSNQLYIQYSNKRNQQKIIFQQKEQFIQVDDSYFEDPKNKKNLENDSEYDD